MDWDGLTILYHAILSTGTVNAASRIQVYGPVYNTHGGLLAANAAGLWSGSLLAPVGYDEYGTAITSYSLVWTGTVPDGSWAGDGCRAWNDPGNGFYGNVGNALQSNGEWISWSLQTCNLTARLYGISPLIPAMAGLSAGGTATFMDGSTSLGTAAVSGNQATFTTSSRERS